MLLNDNIASLLLNSLAFIALAALIYIYLHYRFKLTLQKEKKQLQLTIKLLETELKVNRTLMNPHFIFNSLSSLQNFILKNDIDQANHYLVKFSKLVRKMLDNNASGSITLEAETDTLNRYLEIENLRFDKAITYTFYTDPALNPALVYIPVMMVQPFVENAIWHGLLNKQGEKMLTVSFVTVAPGYVQCTIEDNGLGRKKTNYDRQVKKTSATNFIIQRINLLNKAFHLKCSLAIEDKPNEQGTIVKITLPTQKRNYV